MTEHDALELVQDGIWITIVASAPAVVGAMLVGTLIAFLQAITQIQEVTLTFVPKIVVVFLLSLMAGGYMGGQIQVFAEQVYSRIATGF